MHKTPEPTTSSCFSVSTSPGDKTAVEPPATTNGQLNGSSDTDTKPQSEESESSLQNDESKSVSTVSDERNAKGVSGNAPDPESQWVQVEKRHRNTPGKNKVKLRHTPPEQIKAPFWSQF